LTIACYVSLLQLTREAHEDVLKQIKARDGNRPSMRSSMSDSTKDETGTVVSARVEFYIPVHKHSIRAALMFEHMCVIIADCVC
jgi:hypothetical protein